MSKGHKHLRPDTGKGKEIYEFLVKELGIPEYSTQITVRMKAGDLIRVECEYLPTESARYQEG